MRRLVAGMALAVLVLSACGSESEGTVSTNANTETSQHLAQRLNHAGLCASIERAKGDAARAAAPIGITGVWQCDSSTPPDGSQGGADIGTWVASTAAEKDRVLQKVLSGYSATCSGPGGIGGSGSSESNTTTTYSVPPQVTMQYVEGPNWLAFVGINSDLKAVATALGGHAVTKRCG